MSVLLPKIRKEVKQEKQNIINNKIACLVHKDKRVIKTLDGIEFNFNGLEFAGKFSDVFWGKQYIDPFVEEVVDRLVLKFIKEASENKCNVEEELRFLIDELKKMNAEIFDRMAHTEQLLKGKGYPNTIPKRDVSQKMTNMNNYVDKIVNNEITKFQLRSESHEYAANGKYIRLSYLRKLWKKISHIDFVSKIILSIIGIVIGSVVTYLLTKFSK